MITKIVTTDDIAFTLNSPAPGSSERNGPKITKIEENSAQPYIEVSYSDKTITRIFKHVIRFVVIDAKPKATTGDGDKPKPKSKSTTPVTSRKLPSTKVLNPPRGKS